jgi:hypothetical protein
MKTPLAALAATSMSLIAADVAEAAGPSYFHIDVKYLILIIVILLILNLLCCWWRK